MSHCFFNSQVIIDPSSCKALFVFSPDNSAIPGFPDSGSNPLGNQKICPIQMTYLKKL
jgi:hypothetical protein